MKSILHLNYFFIGLPVLLALLGFLYNPLWLFAAVFPIFTGLFQLIQATCFFIDKNFRSVYLSIYFGATFLFFVLWINTSWQWIWIMPPVLALYLTTLFYMEAKKTQL